MTKVDRKVVILSGPSGVGKDTVIEAWRSRNPRVRRVVAYTTRAPRDGEVLGVDYNFVSEQVFRRMVDDGEFLEWKLVHDNYYGTPVSDLRRMVSEGLVAILKIDVQGALTVMEKLPQVLSVFLLPPSLEELEARIRNRRTESADQMALRLENAKWEMSHADKYDYRVVNDDVLIAVDELEDILIA